MIPTWNRTSLSPWTTRVQKRLMEEGGFRQTRDMWDTVLMIYLLVTNQVGIDGFPDEVNETERIRILVQIADEEVRHTHDCRREIWERVVERVKEEDIAQYQTWRGAMMAYRKAKGI